MKLVLNQNEHAEETCVHIEYPQMTPHLEKVLEVVRNGESDVSLCGRLEVDEVDVFIPVKSIYYFDSVDKRTYAYLDSAVYRISHRLAELEVDLERHGFVRINKSNIVNVYKIAAIKPSANMRVHVVLENGEQLVINRSYKKKFENYLKKKRGV